MITWYVTVLKKASLRFPFEYHKRTYGTYYYTILVPRLEDDALSTDKRWIGG